MVGEDELRVFLFFIVQLFGIGPLSIWFILNPLGISLTYMGRVSIFFGLALLFSGLIDTR